MSRTVSLVQHLQVASPCPISWDEMIGDDRVRFCSRCKLNVYNLSAMTQEQGERLILAKEGRLCARIFQRFDGTVIVRDCPVGLRALRRTTMRALTRVVITLLVIAGAGFAAIAGDRRPDPLAQFPSLKPTMYGDTIQRLERWLNAMAPLPPMAPRPTGIFIMGRIRMDETRDSSKKN